MDQIRWDLAIIQRNLSQISTDPAKFWPDLNRFGQILARSRKIWPNIGPGDKTRDWPDTTWKQETQTEKSNQIIWVGFESFFHPLESFGSSSGWAQT